MDFNDLEDQVVLNLERLKEETERYNEVRSRIGFLSIVYTLFAAYGFQLVLYWLRSETTGLLYSILLFLFVVLVITSVVFAILLINPVKVAYKDLPTFFYTDLKKQYLDNGIAEDETDTYIKTTYRIQLETAVKANFEINNKKSKFHYYAFLTALLAIVPYVGCIGIHLRDQRDGPTKVELTNEIFNRMTKEKGTSDSSNQTKTVVDSSKVIVKPPVLIRENQNKEKPARTSDNERREKKD